jgi:triacylglycerol lipase
MRPFRRIDVAAALLATLTFAGAALWFTPAGADDSPPLTVPVQALEGALHCPAAFVNDGHEPVLLVHGLGATGVENFGWNLARALPAQGFDVCTVDMPARAWSDIQVSSEYVVHAVRTIAAATGRKVDIVGHSEGGFQPRWATRWWSDVRAHVDDIVTLGTPHHGVIDPTLKLLTCPIPCVPGALWQMREGSAFLRALNAGDETPGDISYTSIWSATDELVQVLALGTPTSNLAGASNLMIQDLCPGRPVSHVGLATDAPTFAVILDALTRDGPADRTRVDPITCLQGTIAGLQYTDLRGDPLGLLTGPLSAEWTASEPALRDYVHTS